MQHIALFILSTETAPYHTLLARSPSPTAFLGVYVPLIEASQAVQAILQIDAVRVFLPLLHLPQACLSACTVFLSSIVVPKLQHYEEKTQEAVEYANIVKDQLHKTRTTQTSGALT